ncbi:MAG: indole-3-glycerol phosphate synthase [Alphaproteobacteria bacterium]
MADILAEICARTRDTVTARKTTQPLSELETAINGAPPVRWFRAALTAKHAVRSYGLIAEIKKASPSAGLIRADFDPVALARAYETGGAACLSVLTDEPYFQGCNDYLVKARAACKLPVLRKDFMVDPWQIAESRAIGADCVLLIMAVLDDTQASELAAAARQYGMDALVEVHDENELERAGRLETGFIGINNRNLKTLETDLSVTERLAPLAPPGTLLVCESGLKTADDVDRMAKHGVRSFLVGESLMRQADVTVAVIALIGEPAPSYLNAPKIEAPS